MTETVSDFSAAQLMQYFAAITIDTISEVTLFTIISLSMAVTGAAYYIILSLRDEYKEEVDTACESAPGLLAFVKGIHRQIVENYKQAETAHKMIERWAKCWKRALRFPLLVFCLFVVGISILVVSQSDPSSQTHKWIVFRIIIGVIFLADVCSLFLAYISFRVVRHYYKRLNSAYLIARQTEAEVLKANLKTERTQTAPSDKSKSKSKEAPQNQQPNNPESQQPEVK